MKRFFTTIVATALILTGCKEHCEVDNIPVFELSQSEFQISNTGETVSVKVVSKVNWTAKTTEDWIRLKAEDIESVDGRDADKDFASTITAPFNTNRAGGYVVVEIEITENDNVESRVGEVVFTTKNGQVYSLEIAQEGDPLAIPDDMELAFPDPIFRAYVLKNFDTDKDGKISREEAEEVTSINVGKDLFTPDDEKIASLEGIQYFTNLKHLICGYNKLTDLNVSQNPALYYLSCYSNQLTELDATQNPALTWLSCESNQLTELDVTQNTALIQLLCCSNQLTELDVTQNLKLTSLKCFNNQLTELDVTQNTVLTELWCWSNQLTELDVTHNPALKYLDCYSNQLTELDVTQNPALRQLYCHSNPLTELDVTQNPALKNLFCYYNQLTELDVTQNTALEWLYCHNNQLTELDVTQNSALTDLQCQYNQLTTLDVSKTNLDNSMSFYPLICSPMNGSGLETLYLKEGWSIYGITEDNGRSTSYIPEQTEIIFIN